MFTIEPKGLGKMSDRIHVDINVWCLLGMGEVI